MYAVVKVGGHQYKVSEGDVIEANRLEAAKGDEIVLEEVLLIDNGQSVTIGRPFVKGAKITAKIVDHTQGDKRVAYKYRLRKDSQTKHGFRPQLTELKIGKITV